MNRLLLEKAMRSPALAAFATAMLVCSLPAAGEAPPRFLMACAACHGFDGTGHDASTPNLAGQNEVYLYNQIVAFRSGVRKHPEMNFFSSQIPKPEMQQIIEYYSKLPR